MDIEKLIQIKEYPIKPVSVSGRCFRRVGNIKKGIFEMMGVGKREIHYTLCEPKMSQR